ncbi:MAG: hypothetical protein TEF_04890 [Rhizobiales bacterium NRL2]|jgi:hypothetical protein|nr:MAG: hypothetical protein TEF_04890 [Rhizobiales bacterium NRL2]
MERIGTIRAGMALLAGLTASVLAQGAGNGNGAPPPLPPSRPAETPPPPPPDAADRTEAAEAPRGNAADDAEATEAEIAPAPGPEPPPIPAPERLAEPDVAFAACRAALDVYGAAYEIADRIESEDASCGVARPLRVTEIVPGVVLRPPARMRCATARALAEWVSGFVVPAATHLPDRGRLTGLDHGSVYVCRRRNNSASGRLSEHAFGNAVDVMGFRFAGGDSLAVEPREGEGDAEEAFQQAVRAAACLSFTTVIGPGTDAAHADHLHLDVKVRRRGYRLCQ